LDRALACDEWRIKFPNAMVENLNYERSDHRPILLKFGEEQRQENRGPFVLRFEARWLKEKKITEVVDDAWQASEYLDHNGLASRLALVHDNLHRWDRTVLKKPQNRIKSVKRELEELTRSDISDVNIAREKELAKEIEKLLEQEELFWAQRSRVNWLQFGDKNTNFFHNFASSRRQRNKI
jgi:hypothetical protein